MWTVLSQELTRCVFWTCTAVKHARASPFKNRLGRGPPTDIAARHMRMNDVPKL